VLVIGFSKSVIAIGSGRLETLSLCTKPAVNAKRVVLGVTTAFG